MKLMAVKAANPQARQDELKWLLETVRPMDETSGRESGLQPSTDFDRMPIGVVWRRGKSDHVLQDRDPYTLRTILDIPPGDRSDLEMAREAAVRAQPAWAGARPATRAAVLRKASEILKAQCRRTGLVHVNGQPVVDLPRSPFGGAKSLGLDRFNGRWAIEAFATDRWITVRHEPHALPFDARTVTGARRA